MAFSMNCTNKGCGKQMEPYIDPKTDKVFCSLCDREISNVTYFAKMQMKSSKQFKPKNTESFGAKCQKCGKEGRPKCVKDDIVCGSCSKPLNNLSPIFKNMLKDQLKKAGQDLSVEKDKDPNSD